MLLSNAEVEKQSLLKEVFFMQGSAANTFLKYHRKLLFQQTRELLKAQLGLAVRTAVRMESGPGLWWVLPGKVASSPAAVAESLKSQILHLPPTSLEQTSGNPDFRW